jgi:hypothetical protein
MCPFQRLATKRGRKRNFLPTCFYGSAMVLARERLQPHPQKRFWWKSGAFTPVLVKHSKSFLLIDCISVGVDRMQRNFEPMRKQVEAWQRSELTNVTAKVVIHEAFVEGKLEAPKHLARTVHDLYFEPSYEDFRARTIWSLSNAFTSAFTALDPFHSSELRQNWANSWKPDSRSRSDLKWRFRPPLLLSQ